MTISEKVVLILNFSLIKNLQFLSWFFLDYTYQ